MGGCESEMSGQEVSMHLCSETLTQNNTLCVTTFAKNFQNFSHPSKKKKKTNQNKHDNVDSELKTG